MKKNFLRILFVFLLLLSCVFLGSYTASAASGTCGENLTWTLDDSGTLTISGTGDMYDYSSSSKAPWYTNYVYLTQVRQIVIGKDVTSIGDYAFYEYSYLTKAYINATNIEIGEKAFYGCYNLATVSMAGNTAKIGKSSFAFCTELEYLKFPTYVSGIGDNAFYSCIALEGSLSITGVNSANVGNSAFRDCRLLTNIYLNGNFGEIGENAFVSCAALTSAKIEATQIGATAFNGCSKLVSVTIGENISKIDNNAFKGCGIKNVYISNITSWCNINFANQYANPISVSQRNLYLNNVLVENLVLPNNVERISSYAFMNYSALKTISLPEGLKEISEYSFYGCSNLTNIVLPKNLTIIGKYAFYNCSGISDLSIPSGVASIEDYTFSGCGIKNINIPNTVTSIGVSAFSGCAFSTIDLPDNLNTLSDSIFENCINLNKVSIPDSVSSIGTKAFYKCNAMSNLVIPKSVTTIGNNAFSSNDVIFALYCYEGSYSEEYLKSKGLNYIVIDDIMANGNLSNTINWFLYNNGVLRITGVGQIPENAQNAWSSHAKNIKLISVEDGIENIPNGLVNHCTNLERIRAAASINYIDIDSFTNLSNLKTIQVSSNNSMYSSTDKGLFNKDKTILLLVPIGYDSYYVYDSVKTIDKNSFVLNTSIERIILPETITSIAEGSFTNHNNLKLYVQAGSVGESYAIEHSIPFQIQLDAGSFGSNSKYYIYNDGLMLVNGTGATENYGAYTTPTWKTNYGDAIVNVIIEEGITSIGTRSLAYCESIKTIHLPESVNYISAQAFEYCYDLEVINIPSGVSSLPDKVFRGCTSLDNIILPNTISSIGEKAFESCTSLHEIQFPDNIKTISQYAFNDCSKITTITLPGELNTISQYAFYKCVNLKSVYLPRGIQTVGTSAFEGCSRLLDVYYKGNRADWVLVSTSGSYIDEAYIHCSDDSGVIYSPETDFSFSNGVITGYTGTDKIIVIPDKIDGIAVKMIADRAFQSSDVIQVYIPVGVIQIGEYAFAYSNVRRVVLPDTLRQMGTYAFYSTKLVEIEFPEGLQQIPKYAFAYINNLKKVVVPTTLTTIDYYSFSSSANINEVYIEDLSAWCNIDSAGRYLLDKSDTRLYLHNELVVDLVVPNDIKTIKDYAFYGYEHLKTVRMNSVESIGQMAFGWCPNLEQVVFNEGLLDIKDYAFASCSAIKEIIIPDTVTNLGNNAFVWNSSLENVILGNGVVSIGNYAFEGCENLKNITTGNNIKSVGQEVFSDCNSLLKFSIPNITTIPTKMFYNCYSLKEIEIPKTVTSVGNSAFYACYGITDVYYKGDKDAWAAINLGSDNEPLTYGTVHFGELAETKLSLDYAIGINYKAIRFSVKNVPIGANVILACYNDLGALSYMESIECTEETVSSEFNITNIPSISSAKIMVWENWSNLKPLCKDEPVDIGWFELNEF